MNIGEIVLHTNQITGLPEPAQVVIMGSGLVRLKTIHGEHIRVEASEVVPQSTVTRQDFEAMVEREAELLRLEIEKGEG